MNRLTRSDFEHAVRTAVAGALALYLSKFLGLPEGYWAAISAIIVLQANLGAALRESIYRVAATFVGAVVSIPFVGYFGSNLWGFAAAVFMTVVICSALNLRSGIRLGATTVAVIVLIGHAGKAWSPALHRFLEVSFGVVIALFVANVVFPATAFGKLRGGLSEGFALLAELFDRLMLAYKGLPAEPRDNLWKRMTALTHANEDLQLQSRYESSLWSRDHEAVRQMMDEQLVIYHLLKTLETAVQGTCDNHFYTALTPEIDALCDGISSTLNRLAELPGIKVQPFSPLNLEPLIRALEAKTLEVREQEVSRNFSLQEILHSYTLLVGLENLARAVSEMQTIAMVLDSRSRGTAI